MWLHYIECSLWIFVSYDISRKLLPCQGNSRCAVIASHVHPSRVSRPVLRRSGLEERRCPLWVSSFLLWSGSALPAHRLRDCAFTATPKMQRLWPRYDNSSWGHPLCQALSEALPRAVVWTSALEGRYHATSQTRDLQHREREQFARDHRGGKGHSHSANTPRCL